MIERLVEREIDRERARGVVCIMHLPFLANFFYIRKRKLMMVFVAVFFFNVIR